MSRAPRSPSYPSISLPDAIERLRTLFDIEGTNPADREVIAQALGYKSRNGASDAVIAAMGHYGLFDDAGNRQLRISSIGLDIILAGFGDRERANAVQQAATLPELFTELSAQYGDGKVSNRNLESYLVKNGFNPQAAAKAAKAYRDTVDFVSMETQGLRAISPQPREGIGDFASLESPSARVTFPNSPSQENVVQSLPPDMASSANPPQYTYQTDELTTRLTNKRIARLIIPSEMNSKDFRLLGQWLEQLTEAYLYEEEGKSERDTD